MQFSESWLRSFANPPLDSEGLSHLLTMGGLEVEDRHSAAPPFSHVVVGEVLEVTRHPDADRLNVCKVDVGTGTPLSIVCGAPNVKVGIRVPTALIGASLPPATPDGEPFLIKAAVMRGVASEGMLCSARELKISEDHGGLMILAADAPIGSEVRDLLDLDDQVLTLKLTPNKADCLSVFGVAREVSALASVPLKPVSITPASISIDERLPVTVAAPDLCGRFSGRIIRGVNARAPSPAWMVERLAKSGQRSISALVDISNYVMLELGRPTHVFDLNKISGGVEVRWGRPGERLELLNGNTIEVDANVGVIATASGLESLAGIMGGEASAVTLETADIYVEAAFWWPAAIQGRARRYNFSTDAAHRFERGVDGATTVEHLEYITGLILSICGGKAGPIDDQVLGLPEMNPVPMRLSRAEKIIGIKLDVKEVEDIFARLNFKVQRTGDLFHVTAPSYRFDISIEEDLIEEVARCHGFEHIPANAPVAANVMLEASELSRPGSVLADRLMEADYQEVLNFSFVDRDWEADFAGNADPIKVVNPIASQLAVMRSNLIASLVANVRYNLNRKATRIRVFEQAKVYLRDASIRDGELAVAGIFQPTKIAALAYGPALEEQWGVPNRQIDFFDVKRDLENLLQPQVARFERAEHPALHPGRSAKVLLEGQVIGFLGELHPRLLQKYELPQAPIVFELDVAALRKTQLPTLGEIPRVPAVYRDLALVVDAALEAGRLMGEFTAMAAEDPRLAIVKEVRLFDEYRGKGLKDNEKSLAFRIRLQDTRQTLSDDQIEQTMAILVQAMSDKFDAKQRS
jgi:phenylalanyl-tRNA synthetase beta chain